MCNSVFMNILKQIDHLCDIVLLNGFIELLDVAFHEIYELSSLTILQDEIQALLVLQRIPQFNDAGVFEATEQLLLDHRLILLLLPLQLLLLDLLHRIHLPVTILHHQKNVTIRTLTQSIFYREILRR